MDISQNKKNRLRHLPKRPYQLAKDESFRPEVGRYQKVKPLEGSQVSDPN